MKNLIAACVCICVAGFLVSCVSRLSVVERRSFITNKSPKPVGTVYIVIDKSDYKLRVYDDNGWFASYPVVFGNKTLKDKKMEGDRNTPEGTFQILDKRYHDKWHRFLLLDYPNQESWKKFKHRKERGDIPKSARIGGEIGIHGTLPYFNGVVDGYTNWTEGCISLKNHDVGELYSLIPVGTKVRIKK